MSFAEQLKNIQPVRRGGICTTCVIIATLPLDDAAALNAAFDDSSITHAELGRVFKAEGYDLGTSSIRRHRVKECRQL